MHANTAYLNPDLPIEEKVESLLCQMTPEEKVTHLKAKDLFWRLQAASGLLEDMPGGARVKIEDAPWDLIEKDEEVREAAEGDLFPPFFIMANLSREGLMISRDSITMEFCSPDTITFVLF